MELDCIRTVGRNTCLSIWIEGKMRAVTVSPEAVSAWSSRQAISDEDCIDYLRTHLHLVQGAARERLRRDDLTATEVFLDVAESTTIF